MASILVAMTTALGASAAAAACPNEAFRTGPSALLPECRAYEMVTPVEKESGLGVYDLGGSHVSPSGDGIYFNSITAYAGAQSNVFNNPYIAERTSEAWRTSSIISPFNPRGFQGNAVMGYTTLAVSEDLGLSMTTSREALTPDAIPLGSNLYIRDNRTGAYTLVAAQPGAQAFSEWAVNGQFNLPFADATPDWSRILISSERVLAPGGVEEQPNLYEFSEGHLSLAVAEAIAAGGVRYTPSTERTSNVMSTDGTRFFYNTAGYPNPLYMHRLGQEPLLVSEDPEGNPGPGRFVGATPSGDIAFFLTQQNPGTLYRFEADAPAGERLTAISPPGAGGEPSGLISAYVGEDGTHAYFAAQGRLTADAPPPLPGGRSFNLYAWEGRPGEAGQVRYLGQSEGPENGEAGNGPRTASVSPDGRYFAFESYGRVTPDAIDGSEANCPQEPFRRSSIAGRCSNVFLYAAGTDRPVCVTCSGSPPAGDSRLGGKEQRLENRTVPEAVLDDGMVFFDTPNALVPRDADGVLDTYAWQGGVTQLISAGTDLDPSYFVDASADGADVFFGTQQSLVGQDVGRNADLYDARIDGGLPQAGPVAAPGCIGGDACRSGTSAAPPQAPASGAVRGSGVRRGTCAKAAGRARAARRRASALAKRARRASGGRAGSLRRSAAREARKAKRLGRKATDCRGSNR